MICFFASLRLFFRQAALFLRNEKNALFEKVFMKFHFCEKSMGNMHMFRLISAPIHQNPAKIFYKSNNYHHIDCFDKMNNRV